MPRAVWGRVEVVSRRRGYYEGGGGTGFSQMGRYKKVRRAARNAADVFLNLHSKATFFLTLY